MTNDVKEGTTWYYFYDLCMHMNGCRSIINLELLFPWFLFDIMMSKFTDNSSCKEDCDRCEIWIIVNIVADNKLVVYVDEGMPLGA